MSHNDVQARAHVLKRESVVDLCTVPLHPTEREGGVALFEQDLAVVVSRHPRIIGDMERSRQGWRRPSETASLDLSSNHKLVMVLNFPTLRACERFAA